MNIYLNKETQYTLNKRIEIYQIRTISVKKTIKVHSYQMAMLVLLDEMYHLEKDLKKTLDSLKHPLPERKKSSYKKIIMYKFYSYNLKP